jgi:uncharacterized protein with PIN domain
MRFLLDGMLGRHTRWLRMIGCDAWYDKDGSDAVLLQRAKQDSLILLTCDVQLYRAAIARNIECFLVEGNDEPERLASLAARFNLKLNIDPERSRCPVCGSYIKPVGKEEIASRVPPATFKIYQSFWICTNASCAKVYWQGSHWKRIEETLENARTILEHTQHQLREKNALSVP